MSSSTTSLMQTRSNLPAPEMPRVNVVSALALLVPVLLGGLISWLMFNPAAVIVGLVLGLLLAQARLVLPARFSLLDQFTVPLLY